MYLKKNRQTLQSLLRTFFDELKKIKLVHFFEHKVA